jgi:SHS2 domain-containing protein
VQEPISDNHQHTKFKGFRTMNHSISTPPTGNSVSKRETTREAIITAALEGLHPDEWQGVLEFVSNVKANAHVRKQTPEIRAYRVQQTLVFDLKELYTLVNVCHLTLEKMGQDETDSCSAVLTIVVSRLHEMAEINGERENELEAVAYPEYSEGGEA